MGPRSVGRGKAAYKRFVEQDLAAGAIHSPRGYKIIGFPQNPRFCGRVREFYALMRLWQDGSMMDPAEYLEQ